jgi:hypothetical protein
MSKLLKEPPTVVCVWGGKVKQAIKSLCSISERGEGGKLGCRQHVVPLLGFGEFPERAYVLGLSSQSPGSACYWIFQPMVPKRKEEVASLRVQSSSNNSPRICASPYRKVKVSKDPPPHF